MKLADADEYVAELRAYPELREKKHYPGGQDTLSIDGLTVRVTRYLYEQLIGPIDDGMRLWASCSRRPWCSNPFHRVPGGSAGTTNPDPIVAQQNRAKTQCPKGHDLTNPKNVYTSTDKQGHVHRTCRPCKIRKNRSNR